MVSTTTTGMGGACPNPVVRERRERTGEREGEERERERGGKKKQREERQRHPSFQFLY